MSSWEKSLKEEKTRKNPRNPSFSSSLLDEIYRSIDGNDKKNDQDLNFYRERSYSKKYSHNNHSNGGRAKSSSTVEDEEMASLKRAHLIEKWMEKKVNEKVPSRRNPSTTPTTMLASELDNDPLFFSSTSISSDSSSGGLSSSDTEFFASAKSSKSCFESSRPKPVRTSISPRIGQEKDEFFKESNQKIEENLIKSKSKALKIYANLKKVKQPISPGGRLTTFINSIFTTGNAKKSSKKSKNFCSNDGGYEDASFETKSKSSTPQAASTCSSASSFSRSCLSKTSPNSRMRLNDGVKRTVRFYPVSIIVDEDSRPCGQKRIYDQDSSEIFGRPTLSQNAAESRKFEGLLTARDNLKSRQDIGKDDEDEEDAASDCSSDLFEIDHMALFRNNRFREELPVYETTHVDMNLAIANGLIR